MSLETLPPLREALEAHGLWAKKAYGQHFLLDLNITRKIARLAAFAPGDRVIEVGPGPGGLTRALLEAGAVVIAIEKDERFRPLLEELGQAAPGALTLILADALVANEARLADDRPAHVVANLPYNVGTALLIGWLTGPWTPASMTLMFQKEVAQRLVASPGSPSYGRLSIAAQWRSRPKLSMTVNRSAFVPPPKVTSAAVHIVPSDQPAGVDPLVMERLTEAAFGQRRKMLRSSLKQMPGALDAAQQLGIDPQRRAETLRVDEWIALARALSA